MLLSKIIREKFLPPLMEKGINAICDRNYRIISNKGGYSAFVRASPGGGNYFSVHDGYSDDFFYRDKNDSDVVVYNTEEQALSANWDHFEKYHKKDMTIKV